jgi:alpha-1,6-mannosyltransferase
VGPDGVLLIAVGRFHPEKRHGVIIDGFARAKRRRSGLGLVLVGDGLARKAVEAAADRAGNVFLMGAVSDRALMARIYASADLLVHGSGAETYGLVVAEAICSGLPVVVPDSGGASDFVARAHSAVYATGDSGACGEAILRILGTKAAAAHEPTTATTAVRCAEAHFVDLFTLYERLLNTKCDSRPREG